MTYKYCQPKKTYFYHVGRRVYHDFQTLPVSCQATQHWRRLEWGKLLPAVQIEWCFGPQVFPTAAVCQGGNLVAIPGVSRYFADSALQGWWIAAQEIGIKESLPKGLPDPNGKAVFLVNTTSHMNYATYFLNTSTNDVQCKFQLENLRTSSSATKSYPEVLRNPPWAKPRHRDKTVCKPNEKHLVAWNKFAQEWRNGRSRVIIMS